MTFKLDENGLQIETQSEIFDRLIAKLRGTFGVNLKDEPDSINGQMSNIMAEENATAQQAVLDSHASFDPNGARGRVLDARMGLTGSTRKGEATSSVTGKLTFSSAGTTVNGDLIQKDDDGTQWELIDGPHTAAGPFPEEIEATYQAVEPGATLANAGSSWSLVTAVAGLDSFTNPTDDAEPGRLRAADCDARRDRINELAANGQGPLAAIRGAVLRGVQRAGVSGLLNVRVYHNPRTFPVDADGIPFKAFNVVVETSPAVPTTTQQQAIWDAIWTATGAGGEAYGTDYVGTVTDSEGFAQPVAFDVVALQDIVLEVDVRTSTTEADITPNLTTVIAEKIIEVAQDEFETVGRDVLRDDFVGIVMQMQRDGLISGVDHVDVRMAIDPGSPTDVEKLAISIREKADFDSGNLTVAEV